jgi:hexosaminidase
MKNYNCHQQIDGKHTLKIVVKNLKQLTSTDLKHERYELHLLDKDNWHLRSDYYVGFVRGLETFFQLFERHQKSHIVRGLPIVIEDGPEFLWRGLMIDTSRHFLPVPTIEKIIRSMGYAKLNVLHWHIVDEDSFPMIIPSVPELSQSGQIGGVYTPNEVDGLIVYANIYGISVVF